MPFLSPPVMELNGSDGGVGGGEYLLDGRRLSCSRGGGKRWSRSGAAEERGDGEQASLGRWASKSLIQSPAEKIPCTENLYKAVPRLRECCRQVEAEEVSNSNSPNLGTTL